MDVGGWLGWIVRLNPLTYGVAGLRHYLQNGVERRRAAAVARCMLAGVAGLRRRDAGRRVADCRHAVHRRFVMSDPSTSPSTAVDEPRRIAPSTGAAAAVFPRAAVLVGDGLRRLEMVASAAVRAERGQAILAIWSARRSPNSSSPSAAASRFARADMKGKVWVATYFFTTCPGNCIRLNQQHPTPAQPCRSSRTSPGSASRAIRTPTLSKHFASTPTAGRPIRTAGYSAARSWNTRTESPTA